jgi:hypothetical protein
LKLVWLDGSEVTQVQLRGSLQVALGLVLPLSSSTLPVATEHRIRAGADAAMGYPRFGMLDLSSAIAILHAMIVIYAQVYLAQYYTTATRA